MKSWNTKNNYQITRVLSGRSNAYLITKDDTVILVDTSKKSDLKTLSQDLKALNTGIARINFLVLTHTHFDHCQAAREIKERSACQIIVSAKAEKFVQNGYTPLPRGTLLVTKLIAGLGNIIGKSNFGYAPFQADVLVGHDFVFDFPHSTIKIMETAGHSEDSVSILIDDEIAIVGDLMFGVFRNSIFPPFSDNVQQMIESWGKLLDTNCQVFLPGHGKEINRDLLQKEYIKYHQP